MSYLPDRSNPVIVQVRNSIEALLGLAHATGSVILDESPVDEDELVVNDGAIERTLTFLECLTGAAFEVQIETSAAITGALTPDITDADFALQDYLHNEERVWYSPTNGFYVYWDGVDTWILYDNFGVDAPDTGEGGDICWTRTNASPEGAFAASAEADGEATFALTDELADTLANLVAVINTGQDNPAEVVDPQRGLWATDLAQIDPTAGIVNTIAGARGNVAITRTGTFAVTGMAGGVDGRVGASAAADVDLNLAAQAVSYAHTTAGTAQSVAGTVAFDAGSLVAVMGVDTYVYVGSTKLNCEVAAASRKGALAGVILLVRLAAGAVTLWIDAATAGTVLAWQVEK